MRFNLKRLFLLMLLMLSFVILSGLSVSAGTSDEEDESHVLGYFDIDEEDLIQYVEYNEQKLFIEPVYNVFDLEKRNKEDYKDLGSLQITTGFNRERTTTFSKSKLISGSASEGTVVGIVVFHFEEKAIVVTQQTLTNVGRSSVYNESINIEVGDNYVLFVVKDPKTSELTYKLFKVVRKAEKTKDQLENIQIDFFQDKGESSPSIQQFVPSGFNLGL